MYRPWYLKGKLLVSSIIKFSQLDSIVFEYLLASMMCQPSSNVWKLYTELWYKNLSKKKNQMGVGEVASTVPSNVCWKKATWMHTHTHPNSQIYPPNRRMQGMQMNFNIFKVMLDYRLNSVSQRISQTLDRSLKILQRISKALHGNLKILRTILIILNTSLKSQDSECYSDCSQKNRKPFWLLVLTPKHLSLVKCQPTWMCENWPECGDLSSKQDR